MIKNTFLSNADNASKALRQELTSTCNLHTVLDCPGGTFLGAGVKTVVLFFTKGKPTEKIWFYQLDPGRSLGKTNPLNDDDLKEFVEFQAEFKESERSWFLDLDKVDSESFDLSVKNPNAPEDKPLREPEEIIKEIAELDKESAGILKANRRDDLMSWKLQQWKSVLEIKSGRSQKQVKNLDGKYPIYGSGGIMGYADDFICNEGTTIIGRKGTINKPIYVEEKFWNVDTAFGLSPSEYLDSKFLYYFCLGYDFTKHDKGTTLPSLVKKDLLANVFMAVPPLAEQRKIVEILDEAFKAIALAEANTKKNLANAIELF